MKVARGFQRRLFGGIACFAALIAASGPAFAASDFSKTINQLGVESSPTAPIASAYFNVDGGFTVTSCAYGNVYVDITTDFGRGALAQLLAAKNDGRQLSRIDYTQDSSGICWLSLVEVAN